MSFSASLIRHALYPLWVAKNRGTRLRYLRDYEQSQFASPDVILERQFRQLKEVVRHAFMACRFYRTKFEAAGFHPEELRSANDVHLIPQTSKQEIQEFREEMVAEGVNRAEVIRDMTGGSTGSPMVFYYDKDRRESRHAATIRHNRWAGWDIGDKVAGLWGAPRDTRAQQSWGARARAVLLERLLVLDASALDESRMWEFARRLQRYQPSAMLGYANTLALFARFVEQEGIRGIRPRGIVSSAELLTKENRSVIERVFGCGVHDRYGSRELGIIASECEMRDGMHINAEGLLVEAVPSEGADTGEIVVTDLQNLVMPIIRYRTKDVGRILARRCGCGRGLPLMELVGGRTTDFLVSATGQKVSGVVLATYVITDVPGVRQVQFHQTARGVVTVHLVKGAAWSEETLPTLLKRIERFLGNGTKLEVVFRTEIPNETSGKFRFSVSSLTN